MGRDHDSKLVIEYDSRLSQKEKKNMTAMMMMVVVVAAASVVVVVVVGGGGGGVRWRRIGEEEKDGRAKGMTMKKKSVCSSRLVEAEETV
jgi:uncharacterized membrane protein